MWHHQWEGGTSRSTELPPGGSGENKSIWHETCQLFTCVQGSKFFYPPDIFPNVTSSVGRRGLTFHRITLGVQGKTGPYMTWNISTFYMYEGQVLFHAASFAQGLFIEEELRIILSPWACMTTRTRALYRGGPRKLFKSSSLYKGKGSEFFQSPGYI